MKEKIQIMDKQENTLSKMPKYNPYQTGHGMIGDTKYNRTKQKKEDEKIKKNEDYERE